MTENTESDRTGLRPTKEDRKKFDADLAYGQLHEDKILEMLQDKKIEVKNIYTYTTEGVKQPPAPTALFNNINTSEEDVLGDFDYAESLHEIISDLPVARLANFIAPSIASVPEFVK